jgi:GMP synthase (glutamine-hydrolysing)
VDGAPPSSLPEERVLVLDFGSQYTELIARRVRELGVYAAVLPWDADEGEIRAFAPRAVILSGGPASVCEAGSPRAPAVVFDLGVPILGICYGMQTLAVQLGGAVEPGTPREFGYAEAPLLAEDPVFAPAAEPLVQGGRGLRVWMSHGDRVVRLPPGFRPLLTSPGAPVAAMADRERGYYALQFHPEVHHTPRGNDVLAAFLTRICGFARNWTPETILARLERDLASRLGGRGRVLLALSGGVDSTVTAALLRRVVGARLVPVFVDTGLLRAGERAEVEGFFGPGLVVVDAGARFLEALRGVSDPEEKRKIIGRLFIDVFAEEARRLEDIAWFAQGTIYPDVIESARTRPGSAKAVIKSHHNVGGLPDRLPFPLVEPLRELFKDEVRALGRILGVPHVLLARHPFPGPGLAVRVLGEVTPEALALVRAADRIFLEELRRTGWYERLAQAFAVYLPVRSVAVMGDARRHEPVVALRAVETEDFMTARAAELPADILAACARRITNEVSGLSRVVYDFTSKPPATIEWE